MPANAKGLPHARIPDDPERIAAHLARTEGLDEAIDVATGGIQAAQAEGDFYALSVWREVRRILREWRARGD